ncbi:S1C family serine protease [Nanoarchaeota archaeon]
MPVKKHHKWIIGSFSSILIIFIIVSSILTYTLFVRQEINFNRLSDQITTLQTDTQSKLNDLTKNIMQTKQDLNSLNTQFGSIDEEINLLKASTGEDFSGIIEDVIKSVVTIQTDISQGTGFIISDEGYIVTNAHILSGGSRIQTLTYEQEIISAEFIGYHSELDIALLKIDGDFTSLELADSDQIQIGEKVIAIGNPLGLQFSVSEGIISATHRPGVNEIEAYIQTDAALNPGNSGGPLINKQGKVIGINNFKIGGGESLGFALESNYIKDAVNNIAQQTINQSLIS